MSAIIKLRSCDHGSPISEQSFDCAECAADYRFHRYLTVLVSIAFVLFAILIGGIVTGGW